MSDRLLDAAEVAAMLNVPQSWVRASTRSGAMPHVELGRYKRYRLADVEAWLNACSKPGRAIAFRNRAGDSVPLSVLASGRASLRRCAR